jgi:hypothetical protein
MSVGCLPTMRNLFMTRARIKKHLFFQKKAPIIKIINKKVPRRGKKALRRSKKA